MSDLTKEGILKSNNQQWSSSKIEAEGLEWLYNDPTAQQTNENKLESYLLGESIPGARGELQKTNELESSTLGSLLRDESSNRVYEQTLNKFREDPLFIIKKLEMQQKQVLDKYSAIASNFDKKRKELSKGSDRKHTDKHRHSRDRHEESRHRSSRDHRSDRHRRSEDRHSGSHRRDHRDNDHHSRTHKYRRDDRSMHRKRDSSESSEVYRSRKHRSRSPEAHSKKKKGPEVPRKYDPLKYAFGVNDDICPPDEILATAKRKQQEAKARESERYEFSMVDRDESSLLEQMRQQGSSYIKEKIDNIAKMDLIESVLEKTETKSKRDFISSVKRQAFESADMAGMIRRKASKQQDPFNENI